MRVGKRDGLEHHLDEDLLGIVPPDPGIRLGVLAIEVDYLRDSVRSEVDSFPPIGAASLRR